MFWYNSNSCSPLFGRSTFFYFAHICIAQTNMLNQPPQLWLLRLMSRMILILIPIGVCVCVPRKAAMYFTRLQFCYFNNEWTSIHVLKNPKKLPIWSYSNEVHIYKTLHYYSLLFKLNARQVKVGDNSNKQDK